MQFFKTVLDMPVPEDLKTLTQDTDEVNRRDKTMFWKLKATVAELTHKLFTHSDPLECEEHLKPFAEMF